MKIKAMPINQFTTKLKHILNDAGLYKMLTHLMILTFIIITSQYKCSRYLELLHEISIYRVS